jgi:hypothetical protein
MIDFDVDDEPGPGDTHHLDMISTEAAERLT